MSVFSKNRRGNSGDTVKLHIYDIDHQMNENFHAFGLGMYHTGMETGYPDSSNVY